jgi:hypothetical protein
MLTVNHPGFREESRAVKALLGPPGTVNVILEIAQARSEIPEGMKMYLASQAG